MRRFDMAWHGEGGCVGRAREFCPPDREVTYARWRSEIDGMVDICHQCPVLTQCWEYVNNLFEDEEIVPPGIMAGIVIGANNLPSARYAQHLRRTFRRVSELQGTQPEIHKILRLTAQGHRVRNRKEGQPAVRPLAAV